MRFSVCKTFEFDAAHFLPHYEGICKNLHGHRYKVEVEVSGPELVKGGPSEGMLLDFTDLSVMVKDRIVSVYDHSLLNDFKEFENPTAEVMASHFWQLLLYGLPLEVRLQRVQVWETPQCWAKVEVDANEV